MSTGVERGSSVSGGRCADSGMRRRSGGETAGGDADNFLGSNDGTGEGNGGASDGGRSSASSRGDSTGDSSRDTSHCVLVLSARSWPPQGCRASTVNCTVHSRQRHCRRTESAYVRASDAVCPHAARCCPPRAGRPCTVSFHRLLETAARPLSARSQALTPAVPRIQSLFPALLPHRILPP